MIYPNLPDEFFQIDELISMIGTPQRVRLLSWLRDSDVAHVVGYHGWPLVYRTAMLPAPAQSQHNDDVQFDFGSARAPSRPPSIVR